MELEVTLTAGRRPDLLARTLDSFAQSCLCHFVVKRAFVNIDPAFGDVDDLARCKDIVATRFDDVVLNTPETPSFGAAVKWAWSQTTAKFVLHLEDDWIVRHPITPEMVETCLKFSPEVRNVVLSCPTLGSTGQLFKGKDIKEKMADGTFRTRHKPLFGTSPRFMDGDFTRANAALMDPDYDPEKQMRSKLEVNPKLVEFQQPWRCAILWGPEGEVVIDDIGREWRESRGIEKIVEGGKSVWVQHASES